MASDFLMRIAMKHEQDYAQSKRKQARRAVNSERAEEAQVKVDEAKRRGH